MKDKIRKIKALIKKDRVLYYSGDIGDFYHLPKKELNKLAKDIAELSSTKQPHKSEPSDEMIKSKAYEIVRSQYTEPITDLKGGMQFEREVSMFSLGMKHFRDNYQQPQVDWDEKYEKFKTDCTKKKFKKDGSCSDIFKKSPVNVFWWFKSQLQPKEDNTNNK